MGFRSRLCALALLACLASASAALAAPPTWDHIVIVIEENHALTQVIGSGNAPYIDSLVAGGASLSNMYGITHPSQPNYIQFFSGSNQGITTNNDTSGVTPFNTANLGAELISAGKSFTGYSETMPSVGYTGFDASGGLYARRHNPWVNWQSADAPASNHLLPTVNQPFSAFPGSFASLPNVSIVVPNNQNNMHDGSIAQGDTWLQNNLGAYAAYAANPANNSLLIVTFDEDNSAARNQIPTVLYGAHVQAGAQVAGTWTLHNLLHTVEDSHGLSHAGASQDVRSIVGAFTTDPAVTTKTFQQGVDQYISVTDTWIEQANANTAHGADLKLVADGSPISQGLIRFDGLFGPGQVPAGATILSAKLSFLTGTTANDETANNMSLHQLLVPFTGASTWNSLTGGVNVGSDAVAGPEFTLLPNTQGTYAIFDVTDSITAFANGTATNFGWLINPGGSDGWRFYSSDDALTNRPVLSITYSVPEPSTWLLACCGGLLLVGRRRRPR